MKLRDYQIDLINQTRKAFKQGYKRVLCTLPCGAGKTVCFAYMAMQHVKRGGYVWFLVHRQELIEQTIETFNKFNIPLDNIYIGMVYTAIRKNIPQPTLIIFDEAHHSTAKTWQNIIDKYSDVYIVGLTATPCRLDGSPLGNIYQTLIVGPTVSWLINNHYLANYEYYAPSINIMLPKIKYGDYNTNEMEYESRIYGDILKYIDPNRKIIIYCPNIAFSKMLECEIAQHNYICRHFDGNTPDSERRAIIHEFRNGNIKILLNVDLIGEGFDVPDCDCVMLLRPTLSLALFIQQSSRCLRYVPNKVATIYDFVGNCHRHGLPSDNFEWNLNKKINIRNNNGVADIITRMCKKCYRVYSGINPICPYCGSNNGKTRKQIEMEEQAELERINAIEHKKQRKEQGMATTLNQLVELGKKRGYKNPYYWAKCVYNSRNKNI